MSLHEQMPEFLQRAFERFGKSKHQEDEPINDAGPIETPDVQASAKHEEHEDYDEVDPMDNSIGMHETPPFGHPTVEDKKN